MIKKEDLRREINEGLQNGAILNHAFNMLRVEWEPSESNIKKRADFETQLKQARGMDPDENEEQRAKEFLIVMYQAVRDSDYFISRDPGAYKNVIDYATNGAELRKDTARKITPFPFFVVLIQLYKIVFSIVLRAAGDLDERINDTIAVSMLVNGTELDTDENSPTVKALTEAGEDLNAWADIASLYQEIRERLLKGDELAGSLTKGNTPALFKLPYAEYLTTAETEMLNTITTKRFILDFNAVQYSEEIINSLEPMDEQILNYIVLTLFRNGYFYFTDRHIAAALYKKKASDTVSDQMLKEINDSLARIQNINLPVGYISEEINKKGKQAKIKRDSKLIWLDVINYDYDTKSTVYRIVDRPPYLDYAIQTGRIADYRREIITRDIKGIQKNTKNTTLKQRFIKNITALEKLSSVTMPIYEVYNILAVTDKRKYSEARSKAKKVLDDLQKNDYNFMYDFTKRNGHTAGIKFKKYPDRPLDKKKIQS